MNNYDDIINLNRPISKHQHLGIDSRSAQFAPFAALVGYDEAVKETARLTEKRIEIDDKVLMIIAITSAVIVLISCVELAVIVSLDGYYGDAETLIGEELLFGIFAGAASSLLDILIKQDRAYLLMRELPKNDTDTNVKD